MAEELKLSLTDITFNAFKTDFDQMLRQTIYRMEEQERDEAEITVKMKITLKEDYVPDTSITAYAANREIRRPAFNHKITSEVKYKDEKSGGLFGDYELVWDREKQEYVILPLGKSQTSLFDPPEDSEAIPREELRGLPEPKSIPDFFLTLGFSEMPNSEDEVNMQFRRLMKEAHPDAGGSASAGALEVLKAAVEAARGYFRNEAANKGGAS